MKNKKGDAGDESVRWIIWVAILLAAGVAILLNLKKFI